MLATTRPRSWLLFLLAHCRTAQVAFWIELNVCRERNTGQGVPLLRKPQDWRQGGQMFSLSHPMGEGRGEGRRVFSVLEGRVTFELRSCSNRQNEFRKENEMECEGSKGACDAKEFSLLNPPSPSNDKETFWIVSPNPGWGVQPCTPQ